MLYQPLEFRGQHLEFLRDTTGEIDLAMEASGDADLLAVVR